MLRNYLKTSKNLLENLAKGDNQNTLGKNGVKLVFGNESGDLDSIVSSISYAFHQNIIQNQTKQYVPVLNFKQKEVTSRFELNYLFQLFNYDTNDLIYLNSFDIDQFISQYPNTELVLVDHNIPADTISRFKDKVTEIIDHHVDKTDSYHIDQKIEKEIKLVGSCTTLIFHRICKDIHFYKDVEKDLFWFILSVILLDSNNFNLIEKGIRWNDLDTDAFKGIIDILSSEENDERINIFLSKDKKIDSNKIFDVLLNLKYDEDMNLKLSLQDLFIKDYKAFKYGEINVGYSVFLFSVDKLLEIYSLKQVLEETKRFDLENNLQLHFLMHVWPQKKGFERVFGCHSNDVKLLESLKNYLTNDIKLELEEVKRSDGIDEIMFLRDKTTTYSRKIVEPYICKFFQSYTFE